MQNKLKYLPNLVNLKIKIPLLQILDKYWSKNIIILSRFIIFERLIRIILL